MQLNVDNIKELMAPIAGYQFSQGEDIRYDAEFEQVETEILKLTSLHQDQRTNWQLVQIVSRQLLINRSKDLRLIAWHSAALLKNEGNSSLLMIFKIIINFLEDYGVNCFPLKSSARISVLNWLFERINFNDNEFIKTQSNDDISKLAEALMRCDAELNKQFGEAAPFLQPKIQQLRDTQRRQQQDISAVSTAVVQAVLPVSTALEMAASVNAVSVNGAISTESDSLRIARALQEQSRLLIPYLLQKDLADPRAYMLTRSCAWLQISAAPAANEQKITPLKPLTANKLQEYQQRLAAKEFAALIPDLEMSLSKAPYWFDGHCWCAQALQALGYSAMADYIRHCLNAFLLTFPELITLHFDDGSPFMSAETHVWLYASTTEYLSTDSHVDLSVDQPWLSALKTAQDNVRKNNKVLKQEMRGLQILANTAGSEREKVCWQLALVKLAQQYQRHDLAVLILDDIYQLVSHFQIKKWEPCLLKEILQLWLCSLEKINSKQYSDKINEIKSNLYRLDISIAY